MGYGRKKMEKILEMGQHHSSLDMPIGSNSDATMIDLMENKKEDPPDFSAILNSRNSFLHKNLEKLSDTEQKVLKLYFGIDIQEGLSLKDIGEIVGLSKERVRQIKEEGLANLRDIQWPKDLLLAA
jgi:RNA polymerase primary sigma factor